MHIYSYSKDYFVLFKKKVKDLTVLEFLRSYQHYFKNATDIQRSN